MPVVEVPPTSNFTAGRPKAALLVWFFSDFLLYINIQIGQN